MIAAMKRTSLGFTLAELMVALTIVGILTALATPSFREYTRNTRVTTTQNDLVTALNLARSESLRRSRPVSVCASEDGQTCTTQDKWASGWAAFTAANPAGSGDFNAGDDRLLQKWDAPGGGVLVTGDQPSVEFQPTGMATATILLTVQSPSCRGDGKRSLQVTATGGLFAKKTACDA
ncbi:MAG: GspH/FimT family pseudopilin [Gammaproteobacteria bacterium]